MGSLTRECRRVTSGHSVKPMKFSLRLLWRDARSGELTLFIAALALAVLTVTSISLFSERLQKALTFQATTLLAADLVLESTEVVSTEMVTGTWVKNLSTAQLVQFPSMIFAGDEMFLAAIKAVSEGYPLRGQLKIAQQPFTQGAVTESGPAVGEAWLDSRLFDLLGIVLGDEVWIGENSFLVTAVLVSEPDSGNTWWSLGPRVLFHLADLEKTKVIQPGSRVNYRYLFSGDSQQLTNYRRWLEPKLLKSQRIISLQQERPGVGQALQRAEKFLLLAGLLGVLLASIAVAMAARRYSSRHIDMVAVVKTLGMTPSQLGSMVLMQLSLLTLIGVLLGTGLGWMMHHIFLWAIASWLPQQLPASSMAPYALGAGTGLICSFGFALPLIWQLRNIPALHVLRRDKINLSWSSSGFYIFSSLAIFLLMIIYSHNILLSVLVFGGVLLFAGCSGLLAWGLLAAVKKITIQAGSVWHLAVASVYRHLGQSIVQVVVFALLIMLLLVSVLLRTSMINEWRLQLPQDTPNHFLINIAPHQLQALENVLIENKLNSVGLYPMVRGRLLKINNELAVNKARRQVGELSRALNLTWSSQLPEDNQLQAGQWWETGQYDYQKPALGRVSIEKQLANNLGVKVGDQLTFTIANENLQVTVASIRELAWDKMRPNFYFIFEPGTLEKYSATYITSFYLPLNNKLFINTLLRQFPTVTIFEIDKMINQVSSMVTQVSRAIELVLGLILVAGGLILIACVQSSIDQRLQENALLRTLGASRRLILGSLWMEFALLGAVAGIMAALGAEGLAWVLQHLVFKMQHHIHLWLWWFGPLGGLGIVSVLGVFFCRQVVQVPPLRVLREEA